TYCKDGTPRPPASLPRVSAIDLSSDVGLAACGLLTLNILLGLLLSMRYNPWTHWPHRRFNYFRIHNWTGYIALAVSALHPVIVLFSATANFRVFDIVVPAVAQATAGQLVGRDRSLHVGVGGCHIVRPASDDPPQVEAAALRGVRVGRVFLRPL